MPTKIIKLKLKWNIFLRHLFSLLCLFLHLLSLFNLHPLSATTNIGDQPPFPLSQITFPYPNPKIFRRFLPLAPFFYLSRINFSTNGATWYVIHLLFTSSLSSRSTILCSRIISFIYLLGFFDINCVQSFISPISHDGRDFNDTITTKYISLQM